MRLRICLKQSMTINNRTLWQASAIIVLLFISILFWVTDCSELYYASAVFIGSHSELDYANPENYYCTRQVGVQQINITELSTCSDLTNIRGHGQKVIAFSYFGESNSKRTYIQGIQEIAEIMPTFFPGWVMRVYYLGISRETACKLECQYPHLDLCDITRIPEPPKLKVIHGMLWRFLPLADPLVDIYLSRDLDSRPSAREQAAVEDWLASNKTFHIMRDHPHHREKIMGGLWGTRVSTRREQLRHITDKLLKGGRYSTRYGKDQDLLTEIVWPLVNGDSVQHDSYLCEKIKSNDWHPWPTQRLSNAVDNFVGAPYGSRPIAFTCPIACRPTDHQDWTTC